MPKNIFHIQKSTREEWLTLDDDGMLTHTTEPDGWALGRSEDTSRRYTREDAAKRWPHYANEIMSGYST